MTAQPNAHVRFRRAIERRALWMAEDAARELPNLPLEDALQLVHMYAERRSPKYEKAALRWLERYLTRAAPAPALRGGHSGSGEARGLGQALPSVRNNLNSFIRQVEAQDGKRLFDWQADEQRMQPSGSRPSSASQKPAAHHNPEGPA